MEICLTSQNNNNQHEDAREPVAADGEITIMGQLKTFCAQSSDNIECVRRHEYGIISIPDTEFLTRKPTDGHYTLICKAVI